MEIYICENCSAIFTPKEIKNKRKCPNCKGSRKDVKKNNH